MKKDVKIDSAVILGCILGATGNAAYHQSEISIGILVGILFAFGAHYVYEVIRK